MTTTTSTPPVATAGTAGAVVASTSSAQPASVSAEFPTPERSRTPQVLRRLQVVVALALLITGALTAWVITDLRANLAGTPQLAQQYARLGQVRHALNSAADLAARSVLAGEPANGPKATQASDQLAAAAGLLVDAAKVRPQDADALNQLSQGVLRYAQSLATAAGTSRAAAVPLLTAADAQLDKTLDGVAAIQGRLADEATTDPVSQSMALALWPSLAMLGVVIWVSWVVAQRSHRVVNLGLAGSAIAIVIVLAIALGAQTSASSAAQASRGEQFTHVVNLAVAVDGLDAGERVLTTAVLRQAWGASQEDSYQAARSRVGAPATTEKLPSLKAFDTAKDALSEQMAKGAWVNATKLLAADDDKSLSSTAFTFRDQANAKSEAAVAAAVDGPESARGGMVIQLVLVIMIALAGAALGVLGLARRLQEYR